MLVHPRPEDPVSFERLMFRKVELWAVGLLCLVAFLAVIIVSALARLTAKGDQRFGVAGTWALALSEVPEDVLHAVRLVIQGDRADLDIGEERFAGEQGFEFRTPAGSNPEAGYLLLARYDGDTARSIVELVDLDARQTVHRWKPDYSAINERSSLTSEFTDIRRDNAPNRARTMHPVITAAGELVFQNSSPLVKIGPCGEVIWSIDRLFHHSNEKHPEGGFLVSTFIEPPTIPGVSRVFRDDGIAHVSEDGTILYEKSVAQLLIENEFAHLIYGLDFYSDDPLHLNDVQYVPVDGPYFRRGDLFLSLRNVSAIVLYRPATNEVVWVKQGPWVNQHDVNVLDDHRISVFNNNRFSYADRSVVNGANDVMIYDFALDTTTSPYAKALRDLDVRSPFEGRSEILPDGDVIVEETEGGRILRLKPDGRVEWRYVNRAADGRIYLLNWSRYIPSLEGQAIAARLASLDCAGTRSASR